MIDGREGDLNDLLAEARLQQANEDDWYFCQAVTMKMACAAGPLNPRNEAAALVSLLRDAAELGQLKEKVVHAAEQFSNEAGTGDVQGLNATGSEEMDAWFRKQGGTTRLAAAEFSGLRGVAATEDIAAGEAVVCVPEHLLITAARAKQSDFGRALQQVPGLHDEALLLLWMLVEVHDEESLWAPFWRSLPDTFGTGLSFSDAEIALLEGTPSHAAFASARQHLNTVFSAHVQPAAAALVQAYPGLLQPQWFTWGCFLWATELCYAYALRVTYPVPGTATSDTTTTEAIVPFACLMNHSVRPHVVQYGRLSLAAGGTLRLDFPCFRPVQSGRQCFLSYGAKSNEQLMLFYGFHIPGNPFDEVPIDVEVMSDERDSKVRQVLERLSLPLQHRLRRAQVPTALRETLAVVHASPAELDALLNGGGGGVEEVAPPDGGEGSMIAGVEDLPVSPALRKLFCNSGRSPTAAEAGWATLCKQLNKMQAVFTSRLDTLGKSGDSAVGETRQQTQVLVSQLLEGQLEVVTSCLSQERSSNSFCCQQGSRKVK